ncbi:MAG: DUF1616 domain-containing protein [Euryarchaeota archaeon]|nr:DUF1616 domain-containing protein [Euryarchaeota archaeon]
MEKDGHATQNHTHIDLMLVNRADASHASSSCLPRGLASRGCGWCPGLLLTLNMSRYSLVAALFPEKGDLDGIERIVLSFRAPGTAVVPLLGPGTELHPVRDQA